jgi:hypothetical protein
MGWTHIQGYVPEGLELQSRLATATANLLELARYVAHHKDCGIFDEREDCTCFYPYELVADILEASGCKYEDWDDTTIPQSCHCINLAHKTAECDEQKQEACPQFKAWTDES